MENPTLRLKIRSKTDSVDLLPSNRGGGIADVDAHFGLPCMASRSMTARVLEEVNWPRKGDQGSR